MIESPALLRSYVQGIRRLSGAISATLFIPAQPGGLFRPLLIHEGDAPPVPEMADLEAAEKFARNAPPTSRQGALSRSEAGSTFLASAAAEAGLIPLPLFDDAWDSTPFDAQLAPRRRRDSQASQGDARAGCWLGLRFDPGKGSVLERLAHSHLPTRLRETGDAEDWWNWLFALGGALAGHTTQVSAILKDPVTGLPDRKAFQVVLTEQLERAQAEERALSLLLINPDQFAGLNERWGREAGDRCVREISDRLRATLRMTDLVARYGGVVFAGILVDTAEEEAVEIADRILHQLSDAPYLEDRIELAFSVGVGAADIGSDNASQPLDLVRRTDQALNTAKRRGGGRVVAWRDSDRDKIGDGLDRLSGIFTGHLGKDYRNMALLRDTIDIVAMHPEFEALAATVAEKLYTVFAADRVAVFSRSDQGDLALSFGLTRRDAGGMQSRVETVELQAGEAERLAAAVVTGKAREFRDRDAPAEPRVSFVAPLMAGSECLGCLLIAGRQSVLALDTADLIFLESLAAQIAVALDRARLTAAERNRQEQERRRLRAELGELRQALQQVKMVYRSAEMEDLVATVRRVAPTDATVLITGASGTGKELLARTLHELSRRRGNPFVIVDCGAIAATLIESELFGHERGAYTGAQQRRTGRLVEARNGTVLLDEIGELPLEVQSKLLRFVQEKQFTTVGGSRPQSVDVRIIAATNRNLASEVSAGRFREDLYHRLNVVCLEIPPLRQRPDDILHLARHYLELFSIQYQKGVHQLRVDAEAALLNHEWPGNVRELQNRVMQAVILSDRDEIGPAELGLAAGPPTKAAALAGSARPEDLDSLAAGSEPAPQVAASGLWQRLHGALAEQIDRLAENTPALAVPLGKWLRDDLLIAADDVAQHVARKASSIAGMPESTFRRRLRDASDRAQAGLATRTEGWDQVRQILIALAETADLQGEEELMARTQTVLLEEILARYADNVRAASQLLGVSPPTFRRRVRELEVARGTAGQ